jgi:hypothetical protein
MRLYSLNLYPFPHHITFDNRLFHEQPAAAISRAREKRLYPNTQKMKSID